MLGSAIVLALSTLVLLISSTVRDALILNGDLGRQLQNELDAQLPLLAIPVMQGDPAAIRSVLDSRVRQANIRRLVWRGLDGSVLDVAGEPAAPHSPAWFAAAVGIADPVGSRVLHVDGRDYGSLVMTMSMAAGIDRLWNTFLSTHNLLVLAVGLQWLGIVLILRFGLRPLDALIAGARRLGCGDLTTRIAPKGGPEMRQTIAAFNGMAENLEKTMTDLQRSHEELRIAATAFDSEEAMVVTDTNQLILRVNRAFIEITGFEAEEVLGNTPRMLLADDDDDLYRKTWATVARDKFWQGEVRYRYKRGRIFPVWQSISAVVAASGQVSHHVLAFSDISQRKAAEEQIRNLAFFDSLTQLPNRRLLIDHLHLALASVARHRRHGALLFLDLDFFKTLNDTEGHDAGDQLLVELSRRLRACVREGDTVARLGGDEFVVLLEGLHEDATEAAHQVEALGEGILKAAAQPFPLNNLDYHGTISIGACLFNDAHPGVEELLKRADVAMYQAKFGGRNTLRFFDPRMQEALLTRTAMENDLRQVVAQEQLLLYYQPQLDEHDRVLGAEALLRWQHPLRGLIPPAEFIPLAEETGLILPIGSWVLETACWQLRSWRENPATRDLTLAVNVSAKQFHQPDFVDQVREIVERTGANPARLKLELTESVVIDNIADTVDKMNTLKALGIGFSMDDFGTGYSSLSYLRRLPLDQLKIDRSFINEVDTNAGDAVIVQTIIGMARSLGLHVIAEGVESESQRKFLNRNDCPTFQGFLFSQPVPVSSFETLLWAGPAATRTSTTSAS